MARLDDWEQSIPDPDGMTKLLEDAANLRSMRVVLKGDSDGMDRNIGTAQGALPGIASSLDVAGMQVAPANAQVTQVPDLGYWEPSEGVLPQRKPLQATPVPPLPQQTAQPQPMPTPAKQSEGGGFDWQRAGAALFGGQQGVSQYDAGRIANERLAMDKRAALLQAAREKRLAEGDQFALGEKRVASQNAAAMREPNSPQSQSMRNDAIAQAQAFGRLYPQGKDLADSWIARFRGMSGADVMHAQATAGKIMDMFRNAAKDEAAQKLAEANMGLRQRGVEATERNAANTLAMHELDKTDKDLADLAKVETPLVGAVDTLKQVQNSGVEGGKGEAFFQKVRQFFNIKDEKWDSAEGALNGVINELRHERFGGALTPQEAAAFEAELPGLDVPAATRNVKIKEVIKRIMAKVQTYRDAHPRAMRAKGAANTAKKAPQTPEEWLAANPDDPRAPLVRAKLGK